MENQFTPSRKLAGEYRREYFKYRLVQDSWRGLFNSFISDGFHELSHGRFWKSFSSLSKNGYRKDLSESLEDVIHNYSSRYLTEVSKRGEFNQILLNWLEESLEVPKSKKDFYKRLHNEFFQYVENGGQVQQWGKLRINGKGIEIYDIVEPKIPTLDSFFEDED
ncbi:MAG: hypothetical protein PVJ67_01870 [Candidatus Pacearchaeota archaeon]|jgi:hypothetical protein